MKTELTIKTDIEEGVEINGSEEDVRKLLAILFDNAIKYAKEHRSGAILSCLSGRGDKDIDYVYENNGCGEKFNLDQYNR